MEKSWNCVFEFLWEPCCRARGLNFGLSLDLHLYLVHARNVGSGQTVHIYRFILAFAAQKLLDLLHFHPTLTESRNSVQEC